MIRAIAFNILFYGATAIGCLFLLPMVFTSRARLLKSLFVYFHVVYWIEKYILGLDYKVTGQDHLPANAPFIVAMQHQSAYETTKLHMLFGDVAVVLKKELLQMPLWGRLAAKMDMIAVDRGAKGRAIESMLAGARHVVAQNRNVVIFPQGTRVPVGGSVDKYPYKIGIYKLYSELGLPVVPVALNSGKFWPRHAFFKKGGVVEFQVLPAIPTGLDQAQFMETLKNSIETAKMA